MPQELPGFYYDAEKNRYFPIKGPIPGATRSSSAKPSAQNSATEPTQAGNSCKKPNVRMSQLLQARELDGNAITSQKRKCNFKEEFQKIQVSHPMAWKYKGMDRIGVSALEQMHVGVQTLQGQVETDVLLTGSIYGSLSFSEVGKKGQHYDNRSKYMPDRVWCCDKGKEDCSVVAEPIFGLSRGSLPFSSQISCIKLSGKHSYAVDDGPGIRRALITTLGSGTSGGSVYTLDLVEPLDFSPNILNIRRRLHEVGSFNCTLWAADYDYDGSRAVIGTNLGAALLDVETGMASWFLRCKSDVLAQQIIKSGNVVICGLRNGAIVTVDFREKREEFSSRLIRYRIPCSHLDKTVGSSRKEWFEISGNMSPPQTIRMPSSISCLVSLQFDDQYFLASSMDGTVKLFDHRKIQRGAVQSYEGLVNSHTRIQLGVDPSDKFVLSGGEDYNVRLWSIKSGELLFNEKFCNSVPSTVCWKTDECFKGVQDGRHSYSENLGLGSWLGSHEGLFYMQWL
ncbi:DDB1-and CUL4-associated factor 4 [Quillaja saponaria]|uniref:DDB1-and CUL4-associated factor 4 n=1 Tax=Quillaja saponaria TaxID=32244 RepID=A0AAD7PVH9_QUISA|nr:DDB1-and CUL4-associated factor 4 [Quillaja saponaria]